ncbi:Hypothetical_protein [Hexamita inflata]|uniref:Hypothetical_protein n=1 Tax=Hexamita inflata TaxID=28002 RepID=A0AA86QSV1_9EUKA|nr:Hypothetical protein HINF_LOCUS45040 [Hexamita inflata]
MQLFNLRLIKSFGQSSKVIVWQLIASRSVTFKMSVNQIVFNYSSFYIDNFDSFVTSFLYMLMSISLFQPFSVLFCSMQFLTAGKEQLQALMQSSSVGLSQFVIQYLFALFNEVIGSKFWMKLNSRRKSLKIGSCLHISIEMILLKLIFKQTKLIIFDRQLILEMSFLLTFNLTKEVRGDKSSNLVTKLQLKSKNRIQVSQARAEISFTRFQLKSSETNLLKLESTCMFSILFCPRSRCVKFISEESRDISFNQFMLKFKSVNCTMCSIPYKLPKLQLLIVNFDTFLGHLSKTILQQFITISSLMFTLSVNSILSNEGSFFIINFSLRTYVWYFLIINASWIICLLTDDSFVKSFINFQIQASEQIQEVMLLTQLRQSQLLGSFCSVIISQLNFSSYLTLIKSYNILPSIYKRESNFNVSSGLQIISLLFCKHKFSSFVNFPTLVISNNQLLLMSRIFSRVNLSKSFRSLSQLFQRFNVKSYEAFSIPSELQRPQPLTVRFLRSFGVRSRVKFGQLNILRE